MSGPLSGFQWVNYAARPRQTAGRHAPSSDCNQNSRFCRLYVECELRPANLPGPHSLHSSCALKPHPWCSSARNVPASSERHDRHQWILSLLVIDCTSATATRASGMPTGLCMNPFQSDSLAEMTTHAFNSCMPCLMHLLRCEGKISPVRM